MKNQENVKALDKGGKFEETLRSYFLDLGFYVVRGVKFFYQDFEVTDVDLWLYMRPSSLTRERTNVDIKNKKTPQAIERIFWTKGLQQVLGLERAIVVTTDIRPAVREFGHSTDVSVLDGVFLKRLNKYQDNVNRLSEEEFNRLLNPDKSSKYTNPWQRKIDDSKSLLLSQLDYGGCNYWLDEIKYFIEQTIVQNNQREAACRALYLNISFLLIGLDFILKDLSFLDNGRKNTTLRDGIRYGSSGKAGIDKVIETSTKLLEAYLPNGRELANSLKRSLFSNLDAISADILQEYFTRTDVSRNLFNNAKEFEKLAYSRHFSNPTSISNELQSIIAVVLDFSQTERRLFFDSFDPNLEMSSQISYSNNSLDEATQTDMEVNNDTDNTFGDLKLSNEFEEHN